MTVFEAVILKRQTSPLDSAYRDSMFLNLSLFWFGVVSLDFGGYFFFLMVNSPWTIIGKYWFLRSLTSRCNACCSILWTTYWGCWTWIKIIFNYNSLGVVVGYYNSSIQNSYLIMLFTPKQSSNLGIITHLNDETKITVSAGENCKHLNLFSTGGRHWGGNPCAWSSAQSHL